MEEIRHIKLDSDEAVYLKKEFLNLEIDLLHSLMRLKSYHEKRKKELELLDSVRSKVVEFKVRVNSIESDLPKGIIKKSKPEKVEEKMPKEEKKKEYTIEDDILEIKKKLSLLG